MPQVWVTSTIKVDLQVSSYDDYPEDEAIRVHGWVGDYQVFVSLPYSNKEVQKLRKLKVQD